MLNDPPTVAASKPRATAQIEMILRMSATPAPTPRIIG